MTVARWVPEWDVRGRWPVHPITLSLHGPSRWSDPADKAQLVVYSGGTEVHRADLTWISGFHLYVLRGLPSGEYRLTAELTVDGHPLVIDGPRIAYACYSRRSATSGAGSAQLGWEVSVRFFVATMPPPNSRSRPRTSGRQP